jgi:hypothetical protein
LTCLTQAGFSFEIGAEVGWRFMPIGYHNWTLAMG